MNQVCQRCGDPVDVFQGAHCPDCLAKYAYEEIVRRAIPKKFRGGFETFPAKKYPALLPMLTKATDWAMSFTVKTDTGLFFAGPRGCGKTGLAYAILRRVGMRGFRIAATTTPDLFSRYRATWGNSGESERDIMKEYLNHDVVLLDELGAESQDERNAEYLYLLLDKASREEKPIFIVTCNLNRAARKAYYKTPNGQRLLPRLEQMVLPLGTWPVINLRKDPS